MGALMPFRWLYMFSCAMRGRVSLGNVRIHGIGVAASPGGAPRFCIFLMLLCC